MAIIKVKVIPGSNENKIAGMWQDMLRIKVTAQPEDGKANKACIELISEKLGTQKNRIRLLKGHTSREKLIEISGLSNDEFFNRLR